MKNAMQSSRSLVEICYLPLGRLLPLSPRTQPWHEPGKKSNKLGESSYVAMCDTGPNLRSTHDMGLGQAYGTSNPQTSLSNKVTHFASCHWELGRWDRLLGHTLGGLSAQHQHSNLMHGQAKSNVIKKLFGRNRSQKSSPILKHKKHWTKLRLSSFRLGLPALLEATKSKQRLFNGLRNQTSTASRFTRMISCFHLYLSTNTYIYIYSEVVSYMALPFF